MRKMFFIALAVLMMASCSAAVPASDEKLVGTWKWEHFEEEDGEVRAYSLTLTFGADGVIKMEPFYYDHGADTAFGNYQADGQSIRIVITEIIPFFEEDGGSVYFEVGETMNESYQWRDGKLVTKFLGGEMVFERVK